MCGAVRRLSTMRALAGQCCADLGYPAGVLTSRVAAPVAAAWLSGGLDGLPRSVLLEPIVGEVAGRERTGDQMATLATR